jgi:hypothetical protein
MGKSKQSPRRLLRGIGIAFLMGAGLSLIHAPDAQACPDSSGKRKSRTASSKRGPRYASARKHRQAKPRKSVAENRASVNPYTTPADPFVAELVPAEARARKSRVADVRDSETREIEAGMNEAHETDPAVPESQQVVPLEWAPANSI